MNKLLTMASVAIAAMAIYSCDEDTAAIGQSLTNETDKLSLTSANYEVSTRTIVADSVYTLSNTCYFGCVEDPETGTEVKSEFTSQIHIDEEMYIFPDAQILSRYNDGPAADSCDLVIYVQSPFSVKDSLTAIKMCVSELSTPMEAGQRYYSNYNPLKRGMVREDGIRKEKMFTYGNLTDSDSLRATTGYFHNIRIPLNDYYIDKDGVIYNNYGTYVLQQYFQHPEYFQNSYAFSHHVCPGFFFQIIDGLGFHTKVYGIGLRAYYTVLTDESKVTWTVLPLAGTKEVMQTTLVINDDETIQMLAEETTHTYIKSPAGLFTEVTLPIEEIMRGHENDTLVQAKISFPRYTEDDDTNIDAPDYVLMLPKANLYSFFEKKTIPDNKTSYVARIDNKVYTFNNISALATSLWKNRKLGDKEWNKVVLVPVDYTYNASTYEVTNISNQMSLSSVRLIGGSANAHAPVTISIIYNKAKASVNKRRHIS